eukprot:scaffold599076_cov63-Attheya_sp.AAC.1
MSWRWMADLKVANSPRGVTSCSSLASIAHWTSIFATIVPVSNSPNVARKSKSGETNCALCFARLNK